MDIEWHWCILCMFGRDMRFLFLSLIWPLSLTGHEDLGISEPPCQDFGGWESEPSPRGLWACFESLIISPLKSPCVQCSSQGALVLWCQDFPWFPFLERIHRLPAVLQGSLLDDAATQKALQSFKRLLSFHEQAERILTCVQFGKRLPRNGVLWLPFSLE